jgi:hypothetical protein
MVNNYRYINCGISMHASYGRIQDLKQGQAYKPLHVDQTIQTVGEVLRKK